MSISGENLPVGISDFEKLRSQNARYVDKTSFLRPLLKSAVEVSLLLRPRRFGKTLSMSMLATFMEMNYQDPEDLSRQERLFKGLHVYDNDQELCRQFMGRYPVISVSLKDVDGKTEIDALNCLLDILFELYKKFGFLANSQKLDQTTKKGFAERIEFCQRINRELTKPENKETAKNVIRTSLAFLMSALVEEYGRPVAVLVDEYDVPLQKATVNGYYPEMLELVRSVMSSTFKDNPHLFKGYVTGCLRITHQSIFTGVNNFKTFGTNNRIYSGFIGLTLDETRQLFQDYGLENRLQDAVDWYDGYNFRGTDMLCPWSVLNFMKDALEDDPATFRPQNYWANSSGNDILEICMKHPDETDTMRLQHLMEGKSLEISLMEFASYPRISGESSFDVFGTMMLHTGYFTVNKDGEEKAGDEEKDETKDEIQNETSSVSAKTLIRIPNREVRQCFADKAGELFSRNNSQWLRQALDLRDALLAGDSQKAEDTVNEMLKFFISIKDSAYESFYHGFLAGTLGMTVTSKIKLQSNRESGNGFADMVITDNRSLTAAILEMKKSPSDGPMSMRRICDEALEQIDDTKYDQEFKATYGTIHKYGLAFHCKDCRIAKG